MSESATGETRRFSSLRSTLRWMWSITDSYRGSIALYAALGLMRIAVGWCFIWASKVAVDIASGERAGIVWPVLTLLLLLVVAELSVNAVIGWLAETRNVRMDNDLKQSIFRHLMDCEWRGIERYHTGDVLNRLQGDVAAVVAFVTMTLPNLFILTVELAGSFFLLWWLDATLAYIILCVCPAFVVVGKLYAGRMHTIVREIRDSDSAIHSHIQECLQHRSVIKTLQQTDGTVRHVAATMSRLVGQVRRRTRLSIFANSCISGGFSIGYVLTFGWGVVQIGRGVIGYGTMTAFLQLAMRIQRPVVDLSRLLPSAVRAVTAAERLCELLALPLERATAHPPLHGGIGIRMEAVSFSYPGSNRREVLQSLDFDFPPGSRTAILGETGVGKTTLIRLMLALVRPDSGAVTIYGTSNRHPIDASDRRYLTYVPQGNTLFSGTIRTNLLLAAPAATDDEMWHVLHCAAADFVRSLPLGLDTPCGERGGGLSEGQAQRVAIARALLRDAPILLLDEATSALDTATEQTVISHILDEARGKTLIMVTHRPAAAARCDAILRLGEMN